MKSLIIILLSSTFCLNALANNMSPGGFTFPGNGAYDFDQQDYPNAGFPNGLSNNNYNNNFGNGNNSFFGGQNLIGEQSKLLSKSCPFKKEVKGVKDLLDSTKNQLSILANDSTCANVASAAKVMNQTLTTSLQNAFNSSSSDSGFNGNGYQYSPPMTSTPSCDSYYEQNLAFDYNLALKMSTMDSSTVPASYQRCLMAPDFSICAKDLYVAQLAYMGAKCPEEKLRQSRTQRNTQMAQIMRDLSDNFDALIKNSGSCNNTSVAQTVLQTSLNTLTAFGALAPSMGLAGVGLSVVGKMVGTLFDNFFDKNSPNKLLSAIRKEEQMEDLNCLNYMLQRETLQCEKLVLDKKPTVPQMEGTGACFDYYYNNRQGLAISDFVKQLESIQTVMQNPGSFSPPPKPASDKSFDRIFQSMNKVIVDPLDEGKKVKFSDYLTKVSANLNSSVSLESRANGKVLGDFLTSFKTLENSIYNSGSSVDPATIKQQMDSFKLQAKSLADGAEGNLFENAIANYWENKDQADNFQQIRNFGRLRSDLRIGYESTVDLYRGIQDLEAYGGSQRKLDVAHTAFVNGFKDKFSERLNVLDKTYTSNQSRQSRSDTLLDIVPLVQNCALNAGIYYFEESSNELKSRNYITSSVPSDYQKACGRFSCYLNVFNPESFKTAENRAIAFRSHQCGLIVKYPKILEDVSKEFREKGTICGK